MKPINHLFEMFANGKSVGFVFAENESDALFLTDKLFKDGKNQDVKTQISDLSCLYDMEKELGHLTVLYWSNFPLIEAKLAGIVRPEYRAFCLLRLDAYLGQNWSEDMSTDQLLDWMDRWM